MPRSTALFLVVISRAVGEVLRTLVWSKVFSLDPSLHLGPVNLLPSSSSEWLWSALTRADLQGAFLLFTSSLVMDTFIDPGGKTKKINKKLRVTVKDECLWTKVISINPCCLIKQGCNIYRIPVFLFCSWLSDWPQASRWSIVKDGWLQTVAL